MKVRHATWKLKTLNGKKDQINPKPQYQRTSVWSIEKKRLFIDSILRGYDVPKFYLRETPGTMHSFEVTDGQQRMRSIWEFMSNDLNESYGLAEALVDGINTKDRRYNSLDKLSSRFNDYEINIAIIENASPEEIRSLFARLQMGASLNKVELRHAMASNIGAAIYSVVENHVFFQESSIPNSRYKHQDYLDHVITLAYYENTTNLKAKDIENMYKELANSKANLFSKYINKTNRVLDYMTEINAHSVGMFRNKWAFVDVFWLIFRNLDRIQDIKYSKFAERFRIFESKRLEFNKTPEDLIRDKSLPIYDRDMYKYILAFKYSGNERDNIEIRQNIFEKQFLKKAILLRKGS